MYEGDNKDRMPNITFVGNVITLEGNAMPYDPRESWLPFVIKLRETLDKEKELIINFKFKIFNTSSSRYFMDIFSSFEKSKDKCKVVINWYYPEEDEDDDDLKWLGMTYKERFNLDFNLISYK